MHILDWHMPTWTIVPLFIVSFVLLLFQYYRVNPDRRLLNLHFGMMVGDLVLMMCTITINSGPRLSQIFFALALIWLGSTLWMMRYVPPPRT